MTKEASNVAPVCLGSRTHGPESRWNWTKALTLCGDTWDSSSLRWTAYKQDWQTGPKPKANRLLFFSVSNGQVFVPGVCLADPFFLTGVYLLFLPQPLSLFDIQFLNAVGDLLDLIPALASSSGHLLRYKRPGMGHCSALIKVRGQNTFQPRHETR